MLQLMNELLIQTTREEAEAIYVCQSKLGLKNRLPLWDQGEDQLRLYVLIWGKQPAMACVEILDHDGDT